METVGSSRKQHGRRSSDDITNVNFLSSRGRGREGRDPLSLLSSSLAWTGKPCVPCMFCVHTVCALMMGPQMNKEQFCCCSAFFAHKLSIHSIFTQSCMRYVCAGRRYSTWARAACTQIPQLLIEKSYIRNVCV